MPLNYEFKARCVDLESAKQLLLSRNPDFRGLDHQIDTYFNVPKGRLKLRSGNIESSLIFYEREDVAGAKRSDVRLYPVQPDQPGVLRIILKNVLGILTEVDKSREIYFVDNVKIHLDRVVDLGTFLEVEAIDNDGTIGIDRLKEQCVEFQQLFGIRNEDFVSESYSDLLMRLRK